MKGTKTVDSIGNKRFSSFMWRWLTRLLLLVWTVCVVYPLVWTITNSLKTNKQFYTGTPWDLPKLPLQFLNYLYAWNKSHFGDYFFNSTVVTISSTLISLLLASTTAYVLARYVFRGSKVLYTVYIASMMIPTILGLIPLFFLLNSMHLINSLTGLTLIYSVSVIPFGVFILVDFYKSLPTELEEAATIDGCSLYGTFFRIMLPLSKPGLITVGIMNVLFIWNEYIMATVLVNDPTKYTVPVGLAVMQGEMQYRTEWGPLFSGLVISMIPVLILYSLYQKRITGGMTAGAVKG